MNFLLTTYYPLLLVHVNIECPLLASRYQCIPSPIIVEISDKEKDKLIHQMAYNCDPPNLPKLDDMLKSRQGNRIEIDITPRSREGECKNIIYYYYII